MHYVYLDGSTAAPSYYGRVAYGDTYSVVSPVIGGFTPNIRVCEGTMPARDVIITVIYTANPRRVPAEPGEDLPLIPGHVPYAILDDYDTALGIPNLNINAGDVYE